MSLNQLLQDFTNESGFYQWGVTTLEKPMSFEFYKTWIDNGYHGEMKYLETHLPIKANPQSKWQDLKTALVFSIPYYPLTASEFPLSALKVAYYAQNTDYHYWVKEKLEGLISRLQAVFPNEIFATAVDSSPLMERDLGHRAGLGWFGKNTCLISRNHGSLFFLAEVLTSLPVQQTLSVSRDHCGKCQRCIEVCPTKALEAPHLLNAQKCISYLTIESRKVPPPELRESIGSWFFGCDLCQTVCPWNQKPFSSEIHRDEKYSSVQDQNKLLQEIKFILSSSGKALEKYFFGTPLARAGNFGLKRNAIIVAANSNLTEVAPEIETYLSHEKLGELASWALKKLR